MKHKHIFYIPALVLAVSMLFGCGELAQQVQDGPGAQPSAPTTDGATVDDGTATDLTLPSEDTGVFGQPSAPDSASSQPDGADAGQAARRAPWDALDPMAWLQQHDIAISPQGSHTFTCWGGDRDWNAVGDFTAGVQVSVTESTDGVQAGQKTVTATFSLRLDDNPGDTALFWTSAFDRYTGASFEFAGDAVQPDLPAGFVRLPVGDGHCDVALSFHDSGDYPALVRTVTVTCPADYDGTVFQLGYSSAELSDAALPFETSGEAYTIDQLPNYGSGYLYFSCSDQ